MEMSAFLQFIREHFVHVAPILAVGAAGLVIILERFHALVWDYSFPYAEAFFEKIRYMVLSDRIPEAIAFCEQLASKPVVRIVREGLIRAHQPEPLIEHGLEIAVAQMAERISARTQFLATIANVATLLGLFGTILGLIQSFEAVGNASAQERATLLAGGISVAMNATMLGLGVAIPCLLAYSYLVNRTNRLLAEIELSALRTLDLLKQRLYGADSKPEEGVPASTRLTRTGRSRG